MCFKNQTCGPLNVSGQRVCQVPLKLELKAVVSHPMLGARTGT